MSNKLFSSTVIPYKSLLHGSKMKVSRFLENVIARPIANWARQSSLKKYFYRYRNKWIASSVFSRPHRNDDFCRNPTQSRVLHTYKCSSQVKGGIPWFIDTVSKSLSKSFDFSLLAADKSNNIRDYGYLKEILVKSFATFLSLPIAPFYIFKFRQVAKSYDIIFHHHPFPLADLAFYLFSFKAKLVVYWHSEIVEQKISGRIVKFLILNTLKRAKSIIVSSKYNIAANSLLAKFKDKIEIIPFGIDIKEVDKAKSHKKIAKLQKQYGLFALFVGRLVEYKGLKYLIEAMQSISDLKLIIIGSGVLETQLKNLARSLGVMDRVIFLGNVSEEELLLYYHACYFFVLPSITPNETFGIVQLAAMGCGKAIINTNLQNGVTEVARADKEAITVSTNSSYDLAIAMQKLLDEQDLCAALGQNGQNRARELFSLDKAMEKISRCLRD